jgi:hypothetical protein
MAASMVHVTNRVTPPGSEWQPSSRAGRTWTRGTRPSSPRCTARRARAAWTAGAYHVLTIVLSLSHAHTHAVYVLNSAVLYLTTTEPTTLIAASSQSKCEHGLSPSWTSSRCCWTGWTSWPPREGKGSACAATWRRRTGGVLALFHVFITPQYSL